MRKLIIKIFGLLLLLTNVCFSEVYVSPSIGVGGHTVFRFIPENLEVGKKAASFEWDFGDGEKSTDSGSSHIFNKEGIYTPKLKVVWKSGEISLYDSASVKVLDPKTTTLRLKSTLGKVGDVFRVQDFTDSTSDISIDRVLIDYGDGKKSDARSHVYLTPGTFTVKAYVQASFNRLSYSYEQEVGVARILGSELYVDQGGDGDGFSWSSPLGSLPKAMSLAKTSGVNTIRVSSRYVFPGGTGPYALEIPSGLRVVGGIDLVTKLAGENSFLNVTSKPAQGLVKLNVKSSLEGFTIKNKFPVPSVTMAGEGSSISNCLFEGVGNTSLGIKVTAKDTLIKDSSLKNFSGTQGAALVVDKEAVVSCINTIFTGNKAESGPGIYSEKGSISVSGSTFVGNSSTVSGGVIFARNLKDPLSIDTSRFEGNSSSSGGAIYSDGSSVDLKDSWIQKNTASKGGGLWFNGSSLSTQNCMFIQNIAKECGEGVILVGGSASFLNSTFIGSGIQGTRKSKVLWLDGESVFSSCVVYDRFKETVQTRITPSVSSSLFYLFEVEGASNQKPNFLSETDWRVIDFEFGSNLH